MKRIVCFFLISSFSVFLAPPLNVYSAECDETAKIFSSSYDITVAFDKQGTAKVTQKVSLKNLVSGCFASEYSLKINSVKIKDASGKDSLGNLTTQIKKTEDSSVLTAKLNDAVIGKNKSASFILQYKISELAKKRGFVWDLLIPPIATSEKLTSYKLSVLVPASYGKVFLLEPKVDKITYGQKNTKLVFSSNKNPNQSVHALFGDEQEISFKLKIPLENRSFFSNKFKVYLPPDTEKQQILYSKLTPKPESFSSDELGNYVVQYTVKGRGFMDVSIEGTARIIGSGRKLSSQRPLTSQELEIYEKGGSFVDVEDRLIQEKAKELKSAEAIYDFVAGFLSFDSQGYKKNESKRKEASSLLRSKRSGTNLNFVDLFAAISKASGIATKEVAGFAISSKENLEPVYIGDPLNSKKMHVWAQVYNQENSTWINVDPTWGNTAGIDFFSEDLPDRFVLFFSNDGEDLDSLKNLTAAGSNIEVFFAKKKADYEPKVDMSVVTDQSFAGFPVEIVVRVENSSGISLTNAEIKVMAENVDLIGASELKAPIIFPFEKKEFRFKIRAGDLLHSTQGNIAVEFSAKAGDTDVTKTDQKDVLVKSFFSFGTQQALLILVILLLIIGAAAPKLSRFIKR